MDLDLAFCLDRFIDEQVQLIDDEINSIKEEEIVECRKLEEQQIIFERKKPLPKNKGSHDEDSKLVNQLLEDLHDLDNPKNQTKTIIDDQTCINTLRAELSTKVNAATNYISRLRNLAKPLPKAGGFVEKCNTSIDYFRNTQTFENNFKSLYDIIRESDTDNIVENTQKWWNDTYGCHLHEINKQNDKFNPAVTEKNFAVLSTTNRIIQYVKQLIDARKVVYVPSPRINFINKFVHGLLSIDENKRKEITNDELVEQLNNMSTEEIIAYAKKWLRKRDEIRNEKEEESPYEIKLRDAKAEFGRRIIAQEAKKVALAALLCRLAIGSENTEQFGRKLKNTVAKQRKDNRQNFSVISGDIKDPEVQDLTVLIQYEQGKNDLNEWLSNTGDIKQRFGNDLCVALHIPNNRIRINHIELEKAKLNLSVLPPYGKNVVDSLNGNAPDAAARMEAVRRCCMRFDLHVQSVTLGEFELSFDDRLMDPRWNKLYVWPNNKAASGHYWKDPINQGGKPYYCPSGWKRFGVKVAQDDKEFDARWGSWYVAYHGTRGENASKILTSGLRVSTSGCFFEKGIGRVYVSPSIEYCAHPRYAFPWKQTKRDGENYWYQLVFQCRVNPASIEKTGPETLILDNLKSSTIVDPNFRNDELEWIILAKSGENYIKNDIICYGLMLRVSTIDPGTLPTSAWWKNSLHFDTYKKPQHQK